MSVYLMSDLFRVDGATGDCVESGFLKACDKLSGLSLTAARNQYVSFQIVIAPENGKASDIVVDFTPLSGPDTLAKDQYSCFIEWFHHVEGALVPDMLIPYGQVPCRVPQDEQYLGDQRVGALWVDLYIRKDAPAGDYAGEIMATVDGRAHTFPILLTVKSAVIPEGSRITADFNNYADSLSPHFDSLKANKNRYRDGSYVDVETKFYQMAREHRGLYHNLPYRHSSAIPEGFVPELEGEGKYIRVKSWDLFDQHFGPLLEGSAFKGSRVSEAPVEFMYLPFNLNWPANYEKWGTKGYKTEYRRVIQEFIRHFEEKGWDKTYLEILLNNKKDYRFFPYTIDEIWYEHDEDVVDTYYDIVKDTYEHSHTKFIFRMDSSNHYGNHYDHRFSDMCKMWVAGFSMFNWFPESVAVMKNKGNVLWVYGGVLRSLKESLLSLFVWPIQCLMTGATGFCVWNTTGFGPDPLRSPANLGGEVLFYPGSYFGLEAPLPSIRLKSLRNAMQVADLSMQAEGTPLKSKVDAIVNRHFGLADNGGWWRDKPPFIDTPPRYWDFDSEVGEYALPEMYKGRDPRIAAAIGQEIIALFSGEGEADAQSVVFRFY